MSFAKIRPKRGTSAQWESANPVVLEGEIGFEVPDSGIGTGECKIKIGDGSTAWNDLPYAVDVATDIKNAKKEIRTDSALNHATLQTAINGKVDKNSVVNNCTTEDEGKVLDARQGMALASRIAVLEKLPYIYSGTMSLTANGSVSGVRMFSLDDVKSKIKSMFGDTSSAVTNLKASDVNVLISNTDGNKQTAHTEGTTWLNGYVHACFDKNVGGTFSINYTVVVNI